MFLDVNLKTDFWQTRCYADGYKVLLMLYSLSLSWKEQQKIDKLMLIGHKFTKP